MKSPVSPRAALVLVVALALTLFVPALARTLPLVDDTQGSNTLPHLLEVGERPEVRSLLFLARRLQEDPPSSRRALVIGTVLLDGPPQHDPRYCGDVLHVGSSAFATTTVLYRNKPSVRFAAWGYPPVFMGLPKVGPDTLLVDFGEVHLQPSREVPGRVTGTCPSSSSKGGEIGMGLLAPYPDDSLPFAFIAGTGLSDGLQGSVLDETCVRHTRVSPEGTFTFEGVPPGVYGVSACGEGHPFRVEAGKTTVLR